MERSPVDAAVFSPERIDFAAKPILNDVSELNYIPPETTYIDGGYFDITELQELTPEEHVELKNLINQAKLEIEPRAQNVCKKWKTKTIEAHVRKGLSHENAVAMVDALANSQYKNLPGDFLLHFPRETVTVNYVLNNPEKYDQKSLADPIEGPDYGTSTAKFFWNEGKKPLINSMAHGGAKYFLHRNTPEETRLSLPLPDIEQTNLIEHAVEVCEVDSDYCDPFLPKLPENPLVTAVKKGGYYHELQQEGTHKILCPFSPISDFVSVLVEPSMESSGRYVCHCPACKGNNKFPQLLQHFQISRIEAFNKPTIKIKGGELTTIIDFIEADLAKSGKIFQQGGNIAEVSLDEMGLLTLRVYSKDAVNLLLNYCYTWQQLSRTGKNRAWNVVDAPKKFSDTLYEKPFYASLPKIRALTPQPFFKADLTLCTMDGYNTESGIFGDFDSKKFPIIFNPSQAELSEALGHIQALIAEFMFATEVDKAAAICAIFIAVARSSLNVAPGILVNAKDSGSGKSLFLDLLCVFASTRPAASAVFSDDSSEMCKKMTATYLTNPQVVRFDELTTDLLPDKTLLTALTSEHIEDRLLGGNKIAKLSTNALHLFAGNDVEPLKDMKRRILTVNLFVADEMPAIRKFKSNPLDKLLKKREFYVSQVLTLINWGVKQPIELDHPLGGYKMFDQFCRNTLLKLWFCDPCKNMLENLKQEAGFEQLKGFINAWYSLYGHKSMRVRDLINDTLPSDPLYTELMDIADAGGINFTDKHKQKIGFYIKSKVGKVIDNKKLVLDPNFRGSVKKYLVVLVKHEVVNAIQPESEAKFPLEDVAEAFNDTIQIGDCNNADLSPQLPNNVEEKSKVRVSLKELIIARRAKSAQVQA